MSNTTVNKKKLQKITSKDAKPSKTKVNEVQTGLEFLREHPLFKGMTKSDVKEVASYFDVRRFDKGDFIFRQGDYADRMFIVTFGNVEILSGSNGRSSSFRLYANSSTIEEQSGMSVELDDEMFGDSQIFRVIGPQECFGQKGLAHKSHFYERSAKAQSESVVVLELTRDNFEHGVSKKCFSPLKDLVQAAAEDVFKNALESLPIFKGFSQQKLKGIAQYFQFCTKEEHQVICRKGESVEQLHILLTGEIVIAEKDEDDMITEYGRITRYMEFGGPIDGDQLMYGDMITLKKCTFFVMSNEFIKDFLEFVPVFKDKIMREKTRRQTTKHIIDSMRLFKGLSDGWRHGLENSVKYVTFQPGAMIKEENAVSDKRFYIVIDGAADITINKKKVRTLRKLDYFGECSLLTAQPSSANIVASHEGLCRCLVLEERRFTDLVRSEPSCEAELQLKMAGNKCGLEYFVSHVDGKILLRNFLREEKAEENVDFLEAVAALELLDRKRIQKAVIMAFGMNVHEMKSKKRNIMKKKAHDIYSRFIDTKDLNKINISAQVEAELRDNFKTGNYGFANVFTKAKGSLINMLEFDKFDRFKKSPEFVSFLNDIGVYIEATQDTR